jgi:uroporphyrinogen decarboxylase
MTSRERVLTTLQHREPDRVPYNLRPSEGMRQRLRDELGDPAVDFTEHFAHDVRYAYLALPSRPEGVPDAEWTPSPEPAAVADCAARTRELQARGLAVCGGYACGVFEQAKHWLGDAGALTMPYDDPRRLETILDRITTWKTAVYSAYAEAGVDIVWIGDDLGGQRALVMSPQHYRQWYRPRHERIVAHLRRLRPEVRIAFHCCGHVTPLIPDLLEVGIDILEAVQAEAMDIAYLKREFGRDLAFWGGVGAQSVLARTTPEQVREGVRQTLLTMAPGGGYIAAPCHTLTEEVAWEGVLAFHQALREFGAYPIS